MDVTGAEVHGSEIVPVCQKLFSTKAGEFRSENAESLSVVDYGEPASERPRHLDDGSWL